MADDNHENGTGRTRRKQPDDAERGDDPGDRQRAECRARRREHKIPRQQSWATFRIKGDAPDGAADAYAQCHRESVHSTPCLDLKPATDAPDCRLPGRAWGKKARRGGDESKWGLWRDGNGGLSELRQY